MKNPEDTRERRGILESLCDTARDAQRQVEDAVLTLVPAEVTGHLVAAKKELIRAGQRLGDRYAEELDRRAARAEELHRKG